MSGYTFTQPIYLSIGVASVAGLLMVITTALIIVICVMMKRRQALSITGEWILAELLLECMLFTSIYHLVLFSSLACIQFILPAVWKVGSMSGWE